MPAARLESIVSYCDRLLDLKGFEDYPGAFNGLQAQNKGNVSRIAAAVDASLSTVRMAIQEGADFLIVHHGLFWSARHPWTGTHYELLRLLLDHNIAVYSAHLPLDAHPVLGNNALLCDRLGFKRRRPFFRFKDRTVGFQCASRLSRARLFEKLESVVGGSVLLIPGGPEQCRRVGIVSGGAGGELTEAAAAGVDTFITGEGPHWTYAQAEELGLNVFYAGHYATETFGVRALAEKLADKFGLPWSFLDHPTGL